MTANEKYELWLSKLPDADPLKQELLSLRGNETEIKERFTQDLHFGTAGLRGKVGAGTNNMNFLTIGQATQGIAEYIKKAGTGRHRPRRHHRPRPEAFL